MSTSYITTPIYYVNDRPHIGHCYTTVVADVLARFERLRRGDRLLGGGGSHHPDVFLLTGTDEHADKVVTSAAAHNVSPQAWADVNAAEFKKAFAFMGVSNDDFIRTTEPRHKEKVVEYISALMKSGDIYRGEYTGWYDPGQEEYVTETAAREADFKSAISGRPLVKRTEPCYFFKLSKYQDELRGLIERDVFRVAPEARKSEVLGRLRPPAALNDVPISRPVTDDPATQWGIRVPGDAKNRVYVWIDALFNYLSTVDTAERRRLWPASVHLIGKDILWFHAVIWPALLLALSRSGGDHGWVKLPAMVFGHGWWVSNGEKMSKSMGNFIDIGTLRGYAGRFGLDALRWYLATQGPLSGTDSDFSHAKFVEVYNTDLANGLGNCASRVSNMVEKYFPRDGGGGVLPAAARTTFVAGAKTFDWPAMCAAAVGGTITGIDRGDVGEALTHGIGLVRQVDLFIAETRPFSIAKEIDKGTAKDPEAAKRDLATILYQSAEAIRIATLLLSPAMPGKCREVWSQWNCVPAVAPLEELAKFGGAFGLKPGSVIRKGEALFMRADPAEAAPAAIEG
jgi:methionyl-tRNA synthetase